MLESLAIILIIGTAAKKMTEAIKLPGLVGLVLIGILVGPGGLSLLPPLILQMSAEIRMLALVIILLRAGMGLDLKILRRIGFTALRMSFIPCILEGFAVMLLSQQLLGFSLVQGGVLGFIVAAVSPAVVVPSMMELRKRNLGTGKNVPLIILAGASMDDVFAITIFTVFLSLAIGDGAQADLWRKLSFVPVEIAGGIVLGLILGFLLLMVYRRFNLQLTEKVVLIVGAGVVAVMLGDALSLAGMLAVISMGFILLEKGERQIGRAGQTMDRLWMVAQLFLFILIGAAVDPSVAWQAGGNGALLIGGGLLARSVGVIIATVGSELGVKERLFCAVAYLPKATVQAAIGGVPLAAGVPGGELILAVAVLSVLLTAPLGAVAIKLLAPYLLDYESGDSEGVEAT